MSINKATPLTLVVSITISFVVLIANTAAANGERTDQGLRDKFLREYPEAVKKFEDALDHFHATGRFRQATKSNNDPIWVYVEVWKNGDCLRFNRRYDPEEVRQAKGQKASNVTILRTPELSARVHEPNTSSAVLDILSPVPHLKIDIQVDLFLWRFFKATYCLDGHSVLNGIQQGEWVLTNIAPDSMHEGWVKADFFLRGDKMRTPSGMRPPSGKNAPNARTTIRFAPQENWAIRQLFLTVEPFKSSSNVFIDEVIQLKGGAYIAKKYRCPEYNNIEFELEAFEETVTPMSEFTLTALGLPEPIWVKSPQQRTWLWLLSASLAATALAICFAWLKRRHRPSKNWGERGLTPPARPNF